MVAQLRALESEYVQLINPDIGDILANVGEIVGELLTVLQIINYRLGNVNLPVFWRIPLEAAYIPLEFFNLQ
jgi:hypothetical protein